MHSLTIICFKHVKHKLTYYYMVMCNVFYPKTIYLYNTFHHIHSTTFDIYVSRNNR